MALPEPDAEPLVDVTQIAPPDLASCTDSGSSPVYVSAR